MDYYSILGINKNASPQEVKKAYKKACMKHHPDRGGSEEHFKKINEAYNVLSNSDKRNAYDNPQPNFNFNSSHFAHGHNPFGQGHPFEDMFRTSQTPRNRDITLAAGITLKDVLTGKSLIMQYRLHSGRTETVTVDIPKGAKHGDTIRYEGLGDDGNPRFPRGNLNVRIKVTSVKGWERDGDNLITKKSVNVFDLLLGCAIIVQTLDNKKVQIKIPKGTKPGQIFSINGYGAPNVNTGKSGNLYVSIETEIPNITDQSLLKEIESVRNKIYTKK